MAKEPLLCPVRPPAGRATVYTNSANGLTRAAQPYTIPCRHRARVRAAHARPPARRGRAQNLCGREQAASA